MSKVIEDNIEEELYVPIKERLMQLREDLRTDDSIFADDYMERIKGAVNSLSVDDKMMFLLYVELRSYRKVGKLLNCSHTLVGGEISRIRKEILGRLG